jgi:hypothetical protein
LTATINVIERNAKMFYLRTSNIIVNVRHVDCTSAQFERWKKINFVLTVVALVARNTKTTMMAGIVSWSSLHLAGVWSKAVTFVMILLVKLAVKMFSFTL